MSTIRKPEFNDELILLRLRTVQDALAYEGMSTSDANVLNFLLTEIALKLHELERAREVIEKMAGQFETIEEEFGKIPILLDGIGTEVHKLTTR